MRVLSKLADFVYYVDADDVKSPDWSFVDSLGEEGAIRWEYHVEDELREMWDELPIEARLLIGHYSSLEANLHDDD